MAHGADQPLVISTLHSTPKAPTASPTMHSDSVQSKRDLTSWWKGFKRGNNKSEDNKADHGIFGIPLQESIRYANVAISLFDDHGESYIYGYVPIVVAKCGVFLKEKATETEGIFRLAGSEKRIKELKVAFDSPDRYGKGLDWTGYTVHDAANILRRYFNQLPEPIIPLDFYERFREPLRNHQQQAVGEMESQSPDQGGFDSSGAIRAYQALITELPPLNRQLLLYILDLLAVFASKSDLNKMTTPNLAAIFQPGILSHPQHDMAPQEYRLSQDVLIFLIENQDSFLIGMHGTASDAKTVKDVQSGQHTRDQNVSPTGPGRSKTVAGRSASNASRGTEAGRKFSGIRRNVSNSSRTSRSSSLQAVSPGLGSPAIGTPSVYRSNTVPSSRPAGTSPRFGAKDRGADAPSPSPKLLPPAELDAAALGDELEQQRTATASTTDQYLAAPPAPEIKSATTSESTTPLAAPTEYTTSPLLTPTEHTVRESRPALLTPNAIPRDVSSERSGSHQRLLDIFRQSPGSEIDKRDQRQTRRLQKKRIPGSSLSSAASSAADLGHDGELGDSTTSVVAGHQETEPSSSLRPEPVSFFTAQSSIRELPTRTRAPSDTLRPASPQQSFQSKTSVTDQSDTEFMDESVVAEKKEKKSRWRFSHSTKKHADGNHDTTRSTPAIQTTTSSGLGASAEGSRTNSAANALAGQGDLPQSPTVGHTMAEQSSGLSEADEKKKGPMSWIRGKIQDRKEKEVEKRGKSPASTQNESDRRQSSQLSRRLTEETKSSGEVSREASRPVEQIPGEETPRGNSASHGAAEESVPVAVSIDGTGGQGSK